MDGEITDDTGQPLRTEMIDRSAVPAAQLYDTLDAHDLAAGSPQARRLFEAEPAPQLKRRRGEHRCGSAWLIEVWW